MEKEVYCEEVIISNIERRGKGVEGDPVRRIVQVFKRDGTLIAEHDSQTESIIYNLRKEVAQEVADYNTLKSIYNDLQDVSREMYEILKIIPVSTAGVEFRRVAEAIYNYEKLPNK